jgi:signal peptidase II
MKRWPVLLLGAGALVLADQVTKLAVWRWLRPRGGLEIVPGLFDLSFGMNTGVAFGLLRGSNPALPPFLLTGIGLAAVAVLFVFLYRGRPQDRLLGWALALVLGGAAGNAIDRFRLGAVIDFVDWHLGALHWPAFNLADAGVTVGALLLLVDLWKTR